MNIPKRATKLYGLGASFDGDTPNVAVPINIVGSGKQCDFDISANPDDVYEGAEVCALGLECDNGICKEPGSGIPETVLCLTDADCGDDFYCTNVGVCDSRPGSDIPPSVDEQDSQLVNCNDSYIVEQVQRKIGVEVDGKWGCNSQRALNKKGLNYRTVGSNCTGPLPNPCDYGQCVNGKCPSSPSQPQGGGGTSGDLVKVNEEQITQDKEESKTPWGWIIGGIALAAVAVGGGYYYYSTQKKLPRTLKVNEPKYGGFLVTFEDEGKNVRVSNSDTSFVIPRNVFERGMEEVGFSSWIDSGRIRLDWEEWSYLIDSFNNELRALKSKKTNKR